MILNMQLLTQEKKINFEMISFNILGPSAPQRGVVKM